MAGLTERERRFAKEYLVDLNGTRAAIRAGYAEKSAAATASKLLRRPAVAAYRDGLVKEAFAAVGVTPEFINLGCFEVYRRCMEKTPVLEWDSTQRAWVESGTWQFDAKGALRSLDQMAELLGMKRREESQKQGETVEQYLNRTGGNGREF